MNALSRVADLQPVTSIVSLLSDQPSRTAGLRHHYPCAQQSAVMSALSEPREGRQHRFSGQRTGSLSCSQRDRLRGFSQPGLLINLGQQSADVVRTGPADDPDAEL